VRISRCARVNQLQVRSLYPRQPPLAAVAYQQRELICDALCCDGRFTAHFLQVLPQASRPVAAAEIQA
jgi:hypothetical protein